MHIPIIIFKIMANLKLHRKVHTYCGSKISLKQVAAYVRIHYFQQDLTKFDQSLKQGSPYQAVTGKIYRLKQQF